MPLLDLLQKGGLAVYVLLFLSVISWAIVIERLLNLRPSIFLSRSFKDLKTLLAGGDTEGAIKLLSLDSSVASRILLRILEDYRTGRISKEDLMRALQEELDLVMPKLEKNIPLLSAIASLAPLVGLFGTITGLIKVFSAFSIEQGEQALRLLSSGIGEALVSAAVGLAVAIPALFFYWVFRILAGNILDRLEEELSQVLRVIP
ncbi:MotA/TolQ/ExbB proton channel [Thermocrinis albus DSM 14484]|uniref:MotA/TolQ/ExbB proton channel n=2 Tax=Thermocrinis TaxID=75905 RepID=D3SL79_THEAH|nr:MotA/TolQ/ExbB proton channel [Thermocrinis albus DSM 14484]